ncbi:S-adenosyl-L-methionine-dependent methyltransferase [Mycena kentingensis (nom. inval.)]|nr:S-adenosyl-L-methionine-dependent methyltransferase [Mycena kentingensis (nom. inval.)]
MATFAKQTFNTAMYALARPTYPRPLFDAILAYHAHTMRAPGAKIRWNHALDLGCGTGQATSELLSHASQEGYGFARVTGVDPSAKMVSEAKTAALALGEQGQALSFVNSAAEKLDFLPNNSVDMVIAGAFSFCFSVFVSIDAFAAQAAHWFDWERLWPELSRVVRHGGTVAFWVYTDMRLPKFPQTTSLIREFMQGADPATSLGPHWEPGRRILNNHLLDIAPPEQGWEDLSRIFFTGNYYPELPEPHLAPVLNKTTTWGGGLHSYLRTFSSLHRFQEAFPDDVNHPEGDMATRFLRSLMTAANVPLDEEGLKQEVEIEWPMALVLVRKELDQSDPWQIREKALAERVNAIKVPYDNKMAEMPIAETVEEMSARLDEWLSAQRDVLKIIDAEAQSIPAPVEGAESVHVEGEEPSASAQYEEERFRFFELLEGRRAALNWHLKFRQTFDYALEQAIAIEEEVGTKREDIVAGVDAFLARMRARIQELKVGLPEMDSESEMAFEKLENFSEQDLARLEEAQGLEGIVDVVVEMVKVVANEPIGEMMRGLYIPAATEVVREIPFEDATTINIPEDLTEAEDYLPESEKEQ